MHEIRNHFHMKIGEKLSRIVKLIDSDKPPKRPAVRSLVQDIHDIQKQEEKYLIRLCKILDKYELGETEKPGKSTPSEGDDNKP